ncbi:phospholipid-translocating P-type ATPase [Xylaria sp. CBS 124048]|nr:phospholipid-translocating P-type ATPase [Xylaria sp. CBS 124048]
MNTREVSLADVVMVDLPSQYGERIREGQTDAQNEDGGWSWGLGQFDDGQATDHAHPALFGRLRSKYRVRVTRSVRRARAWRKRMQRFGDQFYRKWIIEGLLRRKPRPPSADGRRVPLNAGAVRTSPIIDERTGKPYESNSIRSSRYTVLSFLPKQLFFQFRRLGNFYFLIISILQQVPGWSPTGRYSTLVPLLVFIAVIIAKEGWDDYRRYLLDREDNLALVAVLAAAGTADTELEAKPHGLFGRKLATTPEPKYGEESASGSQLDKNGEKKWAMIKWCDVRVGDIIRLERNERVPADIALLHATGPNSVAYIDTMALDGETNLKTKQPSTLVVNRCDTISKLENFSAEFVCEDPNADLYDFEGRVTVDDETMPLGINEVVFRGSTIRNTSETIGIVINTGEECKIRMNANQYVRMKSPKVNKFTNRIVISIACLMIVITAGISGGYARWQQRYETKSPFLRLVPISAPRIIFGTIILINALIPLSLYIVIEIVKVVQAFQMNDIEMYDAETDTPISINTNTILEDLGQIDYIFSDKTGTLTENNMQFRKLSVGGTSWFHSINMATEGAKGTSSRMAEKTTDISTVSTGSFTTEKSKAEPVIASTAQSALGTEAMVEYIRRYPTTAFSKQARQFLLCVALCHTCLPETSGDGKITFQATSPDEVALVQAAQDMGYLMVDRLAQSIKLRRPDQSGQPLTETYNVLKVIEFSSRRKRMSIVVRMPDGQICVICKGADNVIMNRLRLAQLATITAGEVDRKARERHSLEAERAMRERDTAIRRNSHSRRSDHFRLHGPQSSKDQRRSSIVSRGEEDPRTLRSDAMELPVEDDEIRDGVIDESVAADEAKVFENCFRHIDEYATEGLRILLYGYRYISDEEYEEWNTAFKAATTSLVDRQEQIEELAEAIEKDFELAGASAIEDRLQTGVPETIDKLRRANIKIWMLTGDKRETAINIARSANLAKPFSQIYTLDATVAEPHDTMMSIFLDVEKSIVSHSVLVIDGHTLGIVEADGLLSRLFFALALRIDSVICCRASPKQKATLIKGVRHAQPSCVTLAIGDGANDIAMIQAAHVGIGISGREGLQAARAADYSVAQFRFLQRLLLVHGHWLYLRTSKYILCTFWKEWVFYIVQAQYQGFDGYSGTSLYQSWSLTAYNAIFTSLPVIFLGVCEQDLSPETLLAVPELYAFGQRNDGINLKRFLSWMLMGTIDSFIVFVIVWAEFRSNFGGFPDDEEFRNHAHDNSLFAMGSLAMTIVIVLINVKILILEMHNKTWLSLFACALSIALWFLFSLVIGALPPKFSWGSIYRVYHGFLQTFGNSLAWWSVAIVGILIAVGFNLGVTAMQRVFFPTDRNLWQEVEKVGRVGGDAKDEEECEGEGERRVNSG